MTPTIETTITETTIWENLAEANHWPDPILLKDMTPEKMPGFPYSRGGFRNRVTGANPDPELSKEIFFIGKYPAMRRKPLVKWLDAKTTGRRAA